MTTEALIGIGISVVNTLLIIGIGAIVQSLRTKSDKIDKLEVDLRTAVGGLIEEKLTATRDRYDGEISAVTKAIDRINTRMDAGDGIFSALKDRDHTLEVKVLDELRRLLEVVATKTDLERVRQEIKRA